MFAVAVAVAGCAKQPPQPLPPPIPLAPPPQVGTPPKRPHKVASHPASKPATTEEPSGVTTESSPPETETPPTATPTTTQPKPMPATLVGLSQAAVRALLGKPATAQESGPGQTWTYRTPACSLTVSFFYDVTRDAFFALSTHADPPPEPECLAHLRGSPHAS